MGDFIGIRTLSDAKQMDTFLPMLDLGSAFAAKRRHVRTPDHELCVALGDGSGTGERRVCRSAMKTIGLVGGMNRESSAIYYRLLKRQHFSSPNTFAKSAIDRN